jgi:hypothetical protein
MARPALNPDPVLSAPLWLRIMVALGLSGLAWAGIALALGASS